MAASTTLVNITDSYSNSVEILSYKIEHDYDKQLSILGVPKSQDTENSSPESTTVKNPLNYNIDLLKLKQVITITGYLLEESGSTALNKKDKLEVILSGGSGYKAGKLTLTWKIGTTTITKYGNIVKVKITEIPNRIGDSHPLTQGKSFMITLQFSVGTHKG